MKRSFYAALTILGTLVLGCSSESGNSDSTPKGQGGSSNKSPGEEVGDNSTGGEPTDRKGVDAEASDPGLEYFVATDGDDVEGDGSADKPFLTLTRAQEVVRGHASKGIRPIYVTLKDGTYYLDETFALTSDDSGTADALVTYRAQNEGGAVLSGGRRLVLAWEEHRGEIMKATTPAGIEFDQLFVDGTTKPMARYPNYTDEVAEYNGYAADAFSPEKAAAWANPAGGFMHVMHVKRWGGYTYKITGKDASNNLTYTGGDQNNRPDGMHESMRMVENIFEELDAPGEWFHDPDANLLYYYPASGSDLNHTQIEVSQLDHIVEFGRTASNAVRFVNFDGFTLRHANRTVMETNEPLLRSDWSIYRGGALFINGAEDIRISNCELDQLGGNGIFVNNYNRRVMIEGCHIHDIGASGIAFVGDPDAVRNPLFQYAQKQSINDISRESGPQTENYPGQSIVNDCLIHDIGTVEKQVAGIQISMSSELTVSYTSIYDTARAGINVSEGTFGGHVIEHVDVFDTVLETRDHGSFNSWGRDRFWRLQGATDEDLLEISLLDSERSTIRNSRFRCDHGWDIDLDDGSSNYAIYNNVLLNNGLKLREGFHREAYNNVVLNNGLHAHVWYATSNDVVERNIFMAAHNAIRMPENGWGDSVNNNFFVSEAQKNANTFYGIDANSTFGDPLFVAPTRGDYRVASNSPALAQGFVNFDTLDVGVQKASLKKIRREPALPALKGVAVPEEAPNAYWNGAFAEQLVGEAFSAYGVDAETGGVVLLNVPEGTLAHQAGLREFDVIVAIEGNHVPTVDDLIAQTKSASGPTLRIQYSREQALAQLTMDAFTTD